MSVRPKADPLLGWAYRPDTVTNAALENGRKKFREHPELGSDRPHERGNMAEAIAAEKTHIAEVAQKRRRKKMAKRVTSSSKKTALPSKKKTARVETAMGKMIPLKSICAEMELDPKATRVKLRRLIEKGDINFHDLSQRWEFTKEQAKIIRSHLS